MKLWETGVMSCASFRIGRSSMLRNAKLGYRTPFTPDIWLMSKQVGLGIFREL